MAQPRKVLLLFIAGVLAAVALGACGSSGTNVTPSDRDKAVNAAQSAYRQFIATGVPLEPGPCVSESLPGVPDWVADIAHEPRLSLDDNPANQCQRYRNGEAHHFVELDENGQLIKAQ